MIIDKNIPDYELLAKYFAGEASISEAKRVDDWKNHGNTDEYNRIYNIWSEYDSIYVNIDVEAALKKVSHRIETKKIRRFLIYTLSAAAAILAIVFSPLIFNISFQSNQLVVLIEPVNNISSVTLDDGTQVSVNKNTKIEVSSNFNSKRLIKIDGEAFFDVKKTESLSQFEVIANNLSVIVVGTKFNVRAFQSSSNVRVSVTEGTVLVKKQNGDLLGTITANNRLSYNYQTNELIIDSIVANYDLYWQSQKIEFDNTSLTEVVEVIANCFDVKIILEVENPNQIFLTTTFENNSLEEIVKIIEITLDLEISYSNNTLVIRDVAK
jgi:ferric-dicitrate binding protein FerR (iron transport regulator)